MWTPHKFSLSSLFLCTAKQKKWHLSSLSLSPVFLSSLFLTFQTECKWRTLFYHSSAVLDFFPTIFLNYFLSPPYSSNFSSISVYNHDTHSLIIFLPDLELGVMDFMNSFMLACYSQLCGTTIEISKTTIFWLYRFE